MGASFDTPAENLAFTAEHTFGFPLLCDMDHAVGKQFGVERGPDENNPQYPKRITYLIDPEGVVRKVYEVTDVGAHPDDVLADLRALT